MRTTFNSFMAMLALISCLLQTVAFSQDPPRKRIRADFLSSAYEARNDARKIGTKFMARGFNITSIAHGNNKGSRVEFEVEVSKGFDYVFFVGVDQPMEFLTKGVDMYIQDDIGNTVAQDTREFKRAAVEFACAYNGTVVVLVDPPADKNVQLCHFAVMAGYQKSGY